MMRSEAIVRETQTEGLKPELVSVHCVQLEDFCLVELIQVYIFCTFLS
jgi:hypothetical protein